MSGSRSLRANSLDFIDSGGHGNRDCPQFLNHRLPDKVSRASLAEQYVEGKLNFVAEIIISTDSRDVEAALWIASDCQALDNVSLAEMNRAHGDASRSINGDDSSVLIPVGELVYIGNAAVKCVVWPDVIKDCGLQIRRDSKLFRNLMKSGYRALPSVSHRKLYLSGGTADRASSTGEGVIQRGPQIVCSVADNERDSAINALRAHINQVVAGLRINIDDNRVSVAWNGLDSGVQLTNVMIGPLNL